MQVKNETQTGFKAEIKIIPPWAWTLAFIGFASGQIFFDVVMGGQTGAPPAWARVLLGLSAGIVIGCYFLLLGYVSSDAKRRGMSPLLWTLVAIFIPNCLGFLLYFILRQPRRRTCPQCGNDVRTEFNYCPKCDYKLTPSCPQCRRLVGVNDVYCPYCGSLLGQGAEPDEAASPPARAEKY